MNISKLTILPQSKNLPKITFKNPDKDMVNYQLEKSIAMNDNNLPKRIIKKIVKERNIPSFINPECYVAHSNATNKSCTSENPFVLGGYRLDFLS